MALFTRARHVCALVLFHRYAYCRVSRLSGLVGSLWVLSLTHSSFWAPPCTYLVRSYSPRERGLADGAEGCCSRLDSGLESVKFHCVTPTSCCDLVLGARRKGRTASYYHQPGLGGDSTGGALGRQSFLRPGPGSCLAGADSDVPCLILG